MYAATSFSKNSEDKLAYLWLLNIGERLLFFVYLLWDPWLIWKALSDGGLILIFGWFTGIFGVLELVFEVYGFWVGIWGGGLVFISVLVWTGGGGGGGKVTGFCVIVFVGGGGGGGRTFVFVVVFWIGGGGGGGGKVLGFWLFIAVFKLGGGPIAVFKLGGGPSLVFKLGGGGKFPIGGGGGGGGRLLKLGKFILGGGGGGGGKLGRLGELIEVFVLVVVPPDDFPPNCFSNISLALLKFYWLPWIYYFGGGGGGD